MYILDVLVHWHCIKMHFALASDSVLCLSSLLYVTPVHGGGDLVMTVPPYPSFSPVYGAWGAL